MRTLQKREEVIQGRRRGEIEGRVERKGVRGRSEKRKKKQ